MLPTSRLYTLTGSTPVTPELLNALQDMIVGAKFPELNFPVSAFALMAFGGGGTLSNAGLWTFSGTTELIWPVERVPVGTRINAFEWTVNRGGTGSIVFQLYKRAHGSASAPAAVGAASTLSTGTGMTTHTYSPAYTIEASYDVWLSITANNAANQVAGGRMKADRL